MTKSVDKTLLGHPVGLFILFFTEMWERFSYYGMRVLLVLYMTKHLIHSVHEGAYVWGFPTLEWILTSAFGEMAVQQLSSQIYGLYTGLVYFTPVFGGMLADKVLGQRKTVVIGGVLMAIGHFLMAFESLFILALLFIIMGNGAFKPNISTQVGSLYPPGDPRRDSAFTIFYMGINLGAFLSPIICGTLGEVYGWHYGFAAAGVGMLLGLVVYLWGQKYLGEDIFVKEHKSKTKKPDAPLTAKEWKAVFGLIGLCALNIIFWSVYEQQGNTLQLFAFERTNWQIGNFSVPSTWLQTLNPLFIFMFAPLLIKRWEKQGKKQFTSVAKMSVGCFLLGLSFIPLIYVTATLGAEDKIYWLWFVPTLWILTMGELYLSPIGLSLVTKVAPAKIASLMMGIWLMSSFFGNFISGYIGTFYSTMGVSSFFTLLLVIGVAAGFAFFILQKPLKNAIGSEV
jgi:proton-dependent oligopeptide transporter, POT family